MKIMYFVHRYEESGGMERVLSRKANYLVINGYDVSIVSLIKSKGTVFYQFDSKIKIFEVDGLEGEEKDKRNLGSYLAYCQAIVDREKPDICISTGVELTQYIYKLTDLSVKILEEHFSKFKRKTNIGRLSGHWYGKFIGDFYSRQKRSIVTKFDKYIVLTHEDRKQWRELNDDQIEVIPNMITIDKPKTAPDYSKKRIVAVGRLTGQKGWPYLISAWAKIAKKYPDWEVAICGEGGYRDRYQKQINQLGIANSFKMIGLVKDIEKELLNSSLLVLSSKHEGQPLVIIEAMVTGIPCVAFACKCGPRDIIKDGEDGFLVKPYSITELSLNLEKMIQSETLRREMGQKAAENIQRYSPDLIMPLWDDLFKRLTSKE